MSAHPHHAQLVTLAHEYLSAQWAHEAQLLRYLDRNVSSTCAPITPAHVRAVLITLELRGDAERAHFPGDRVVHWRRRRAVAA